MKIKLQKEMFYLHEGLKTLRKGGFYKVKVVLEKTSGKEYLLYNYGSRTFVRNITENSIYASMNELDEIITEKFLTKESRWGERTEDDFVDIEDVLKQDPEYQKLQALWWQVKVGYSYEVEMEIPDGIL